MATNAKRGVLCVVAASVNTAFFSFGSSVILLLMKPLVEATGCSFPQATMMFSFMTMGVAFTALFAGKIIASFNPKIILMISSLPALLLFGSMSVTDSIYVFWALSFLFGVSIVFMGPTTNQIFITSWFAKGTGTIITVAHVLTGLVATVMTPILAMFITSHGYKTGALYAGIGITGIGLLMSLLFICKLPSAYGLEPISWNIGKNKEEKVKGNNSDLVWGTPADEPYAIPVKRFFRIPVFYFVMISAFLLTVANGLYYYNSSLIFQSMGLDLVETSYVLSLTHIASMVLAPLFGILCDSIGSKRAILLYSTVGAVLFLSFGLLNGMTGAIILALLCNISQFSLFYSGVVMPKLFGTKNSPVIISWGFTFAAIGSTVSGTIGAYLAVLGGGKYVTTLFVAGIIYVLVIAFTLLFFTKRTKEKMQEIDKDYQVPA
ncbi:MFS transporter [Desulfitobacterium hafniense]|nr:MFS transporter [Desulfitobacterium hafniense]